MRLEGLGCGRTRPFANGSWIPARTVPHKADHPDFRWYNARSSAACLSLGLLNGPVPRALCFGSVQSLSLSLSLSLVQLLKCDAETELQDRRASEGWLTRQCARERRRRVVRSCRRGGDARKTWARGRLSAGSAVSSSADYKRAYGGWFLSTRAFLSPVSLVNARAAARWRAPPRFMDSCRRARVSKDGRGCTFAKAIYICREVRGYTHVRGHCCHCQRRVAVSCRCDVQRATSTLRGSAYKGVSQTEVCVCVGIIRLRTFVRVCAARIRLM